MKIKLIMVATLMATAAHIYSVEADTLLTPADFGQSYLPGTRSMPWNYYTIVEAKQEAEAYSEIASLESRLSGGQITQAQYDVYAKPLIDRINKIERAAAARAQKK